MKPKLILCLALVLSGILFASFMVWSPIFRKHTTSPSNECVINLERLNEAKNEWALELHKTTNDTPTWNDLIGHYMKEMPVCPAGGTYTIGRVGEVPTCSIGRTILPGHWINDDQK